MGLGSPLAMPLPEPGLFLLQQLKDTMELTGKIELPLQPMEDAEKEAISSYIANLVRENLNELFDSVSPENEPEEYEEIKSIQGEMNAIFNKYEGKFTENAEGFDRDITPLTQRLEGLGRRMMIRSIPAKGT